MQREIVWDYLQKHHIVLTRDVRETAKQLGYSVSSYSQATELIQSANVKKRDLNRDGFSLIINGVRHILYSDDLSRPKAKAVVLHELGHFVMNASFGGSQEATNEKERLKKEKEADLFLYEFYPSPVLFKANLTTIESIAKFTGLDAETVQEIYTRVKAYGDEKMWSKACDKICDTYSDIIATAKTGSADNQPNEDADHDKRRSRTWHTIEIGILSIIAVSILAIASFVVAKFAVGGGDVAPDSSITSVATTRPTVDLDTLIDNAHQAVGITSGTDQSDGTRATESTNNAAPHSDTIVYVTAAGEKYHLPDCYHIKNKDGLREMTVEQAETAGYEPCKDCIG